VKAKTDKLNKWDFKESRGEKKKNKKRSGVMKEGSQNNNN
jgi:hypothetical protein